MENLKVKKILPLGLSLALAVTPIAEEIIPTFNTAHAETTSEQPSDEQEIPAFSLQAQTPEEHAPLEEQETSTPMTYDEYVSGVGACWDYLCGFNKFYYEHMAQDLQSAYHHTNYEYIDDALTQQLEAQDVIADDIVVDENGKTNPPSEWINVQNCNSLFNEINNYNEIHISAAYGRYVAQGITDVSFADYVMPELINPSILCYDEHDREDVNQLFENYVKGYNLAKGSLHTNSNFLDAYRQITQVGDNENDLFDSSIGVRWMQLKTVGNQMRQFLRDFMWTNYESELKKYMKPNKLSQTQLELEDGQTFMFPENEIEEACLYFGILKEFCNDKVNKDLFTLLRDNAILSVQAQEEAAKAK